VWLLISQEARLDIDATDGVLREVDRSEGLDVDIGYTADERVEEFPGRHQTSVGNSTCKKYHNCYYLKLSALSIHF